MTRVPRVMPQTSPLTPLVLYLAAGWYLTFRLHFFIGDTLARLANASYIVYSRDPHLAAIGFAWLPLPSLLELPFIMALRPFGLELYAAACVTALASTLNVLLVWRIVRQIGVSGWPCAILVAIYALNPFVIMYAANGMSEALLMTPILATISFLMSWRDTESPGPLLAAGLMCGLAWWVRFESAALLAAGCAVIAGLWWARHRDDPDRLEGELLAFASPFVFSVGMWLLASWLITGSPFYFISGPGNNAADSLLQLKRSGSEVVTLYHHPLLALRYVLVRCIWYMPAIAPLGAIAAVWCIARRRTGLLLPVLVPIPILLMHVYLLNGLQSYGEFRYYFYILPVGIFAAAIVARLCLDSWRSRHGISPAVAVVLLATALSIPSTFIAMGNVALGRQETPLLDLLAGRSTSQTRMGTWGDERHLSTWIDGLHLRDGSILLDTTNGFPMFLFSAHPRQYIVPSDPDFNSTLAQLQLFHGYVLVSGSAVQASILIRKAYPGLLTGQANWVRVVHQQGPWVLYRIVPGS